MKKLTIEEMQKIAESRGGMCLSKDYVNSHTELKWQCKAGHVWVAKPTNIVNGRWCPHCAGVARFTIEYMQEIAESRGGKCLSEKYGNTFTKLKWQCKKGHSWEATPNSVKRGTWCPYCCGHEKLTIAQMQKIAESRGGKCLSKEYVNSLTKLKWQCKKGHVWEAKPSSVKRGTWCPGCAKKGKKKKQNE